MKRSVSQFQIFIYYRYQRYKKLAIKSVFKVSGVESCPLFFILCFTALISSTANQICLHQLFNLFLILLSKMVVKIRLQRFGRRNLPFYRIVLADSQWPRDGKFIERVRNYHIHYFYGINEISFFCSWEHTIRCPCKINVKKSQQIQNV